MGGSKVILVGATSLIVGIYSVSVKKVESNYVTTALNRASSMQAERVAEASLRLAVDEVARYGWNWKKLVKKNLLGGSAEYLIDRKGTYADITTTVEFGGIKRLATARVYKTDYRVKQGFKKIHRGKWEVVKMYTKPG